MKYPGVIALAVLLSAGLPGLAADPPPELQPRIEAAFKAWKQAATEQEKAEVRRQFGPFDAEFQKWLSVWGEAAQKQGNFPASVERFQFCAQESEVLSDWFHVSICIQLIGGTERLQGKYPEAEGHYKLALEYSRRPGAERRTPLVMNNLSGVYAGQARYPEAVEILNQVLDFNRKAGLQDDPAPYQNLAIVHALRGDNVSSLGSFMKALAIYEKLGDNKKLGLTHYNLGVLHLKQGNHDAAGHEFVESMVLSEKAGDRTQLCLTLGDLGRVRDLEGHAGEALRLALLTGGVIPKGDGGDGSYAVNGARADNTGFLLDGMNNTQRRNTGAVLSPPIEGVQEFKLQTSGFAAEYGRYAGGLLTVVTKSGTNRLRGALYEFLRNDAFDAVGYFDGQKSKLRRNQFGATVGGPVLLPRIYNGRNRTFFLFTWDSLRLIQGQSQRGLTPRPEMLKGDFSGATDAFGKPITLLDTVSRSPFPGNRIPASRLNPVAAKLAGYYPLPNLPAGGVFNYIAQGNGTNSSNNYGIKIDHNFSSNDRMTASAFWSPAAVYDPINSNNSPIPYFGLSNKTLAMVSYLKYIRTISPTMFVETSANFSRTTNHQVWPLSGDTDWGAQTGFVGGTTNPVANGLPYLTLTGYLSLGPANTIPKIYSFNNYQYSGSLTWIKGLHSFKFGGDFLRS
ncbi:MAG: tetratricopeptide repeat protein [Acidobacteriia bacterium]|nr:tetratricopeptide repeat protein [Terriglobia bacterium]